MGSPIIIDTDAGTDDILALSYLLSLPDLQIEAITIVHGLAHVRDGSRNIRRLLHLAGRADIPVLEGAESPIEGSRPFPAEWRFVANNLPGVTLPDIVGPPSTQGAVDFLKRRMQDKERPVRILGLGPLTNLALALREVPDASATVEELVIMGGALQVPGNLSAGNPEKAANEVAEWNIYVDPHAAVEVFKSDIQMLLVPLDATMHVPITRSFAENFGRRSLTPLGCVVAQVLEAALPYIDAHAYFAWDPLAAVALVDRSVLQAKKAAIQVTTSGQNIGQTKLIRWDADSPLAVGMDANAAAFTAEFEQTLGGFNTKTQRHKDTKKGRTKWF